MYSIENTKVTPQEKLVNVQTIEEWKLSQACYNPLFQLAVVVNDKMNEHPERTANPEFLKEVLRCFELPDVVAAWWDVRRTFFMEIPCSAASNKILTLSFCHWMIVWRSDTNSGRVRAILLCNSDSWAETTIVDNIQGFINDIAPITPPHELAGLLAIFLYLTAGSKQLRNSQDQAYSTYWDLHKIMEKNIVQQAEDLSTFTANQYKNAVQAACERAYTDVITSYIDYLLDSCHNSSVQSQSTTYRDYLLSLKRLAVGLTADLTLVGQNITTNISLIYNLKTQRDQANGLAIAAATQEIALQSRRDQENSLAIADASKRIAEESRKDSRAMKMIAIVTMIYLPGTFVATAFSMGIFEWSANSSDVVNPRIWVYFLFTGILTILTVGGFLGWMWWQERRPEKDPHTASEVPESVESVKPTLKTE